jgi:dTDP-4-amino-4,6-dideoxygalactose transaminase
MLLVSEPSLGNEEKAALARVIDSNWITMGSCVDSFEKAFARMHGVSEAVAVDSCTAALHLAVEALGIGPGDEVLVPSLSFVATSNAVLYSGATPVFVDIESLASPVISVAHAAELCTDRTRAIVVMHYAGYIAGREAWTGLASSRGLRLIEDSAHAVGAGRGEIFGDVAAFSFYGNKNMTTAEGGMLTARDPDVLARARQARSHGMTATTVQRLTGQALSYDVTMLGYNYRMDELRAAIGLVQIDSLGAWNRKRRALTLRYRDRLRDRCPGVTVPFSGAHLSTHHILPVILPAGVRRQEVAGRLRAQGIQTTHHYPPIHLLSLYRERFPGLHLPLTEEFSTRELTVPLHPKMQMEDVERVVDALADALGSAGEEAELEHARV